MAVRRAPGDLGSVIGSIETRLRRLELKGRGFALDDIASGIATYPSAEMPVGGEYNEGDLWFDTNDGNKIYRWDGDSWEPVSAMQKDSVRDAAATALVAAQEPSAYVDNTVVTYVQDTAPTSHAYGDLWIDTDDSKLYRWGGSTWVDTTDTSVGDAVLQPENAISYADGRIVTWWQFDEPTATGFGDLWVDTNGGNQLYRWNNTDWVKVLDWSLYLLTHTKISTFYQTEIPTSTAIGDIWFNVSDGNMQYRAESVGADEIAPGEWVEVQDEDIGDALDAANEALEAADDALTAADGKNSVFRQTAMPTGGEYQTGDIWYDSDDGNKIYVYDGSTFVVATASHLLTPNGKLVVSPTGLICYNAGGSITFSLNAANGAVYTAGPVVSGGDISGAYVTGGVLQTEYAYNRGIKITSAGMTAWNPNTGQESFKLDTSAGLTTITGGVFRTDVYTSRGVVMDRTGVHGYDADGIETFFLNSGNGNLISNGGNFQTAKGSNPRLAIGANVAGSAATIAYWGTGNYIRSQMTFNDTGLAITGNMSATDFSGRDVHITGKLTIDYGGILVLDGGITSNADTNILGYTQFKGGLSLNGNKIYNCGYIDVNGTCTVNLLEVNNKTSFRADITMYNNQIVMQGNNIISCGNINFNPNKILYADTLQINGAGKWSSLVGSGTRPVNVGPGGVLQAGGSSRRLKENFEDVTLEDAKRLYQVDPIIWNYKDRERYGDRRYAGFGAEDLDEVGLDVYLDYDEDGRPENVRKEELVAPLLILVKDLNKRVQRLEAFNARY